MVSMRDIAEAAGVSRPTVSYVLNENKTSVRISQATKKHILETAARLGYRRNELAVSMKRGRSNVAGFIGHLKGEYILESISGINDFLQSNGWLVKLFGTSVNENDFEKIGRQCVEQRLGGVICHTLHKEPLEALHRELDQAGIPMILIGDRISGDTSLRLMSDCISGMEQVVNHLVELGHHRIAHVAHIPHEIAREARLNGFKSGMNKHGLQCSKLNIVYISGSREITDEDYQKFDLLYKDFKPTAITCGTDHIAFKVLNWAYARKIAVPSTLSVTGFAGLTAAYTSAPALTTVIQPFYEIGHQAAECLFKQIDGQPVKDMTFPVELLIQESTGKCRSRRGKKQ